MSELSEPADKYDDMLHLASVLDASGEELRQRAKLGSEVIADPAFADSAELSPQTQIGRAHV